MKPLAITLILLAFVGCSQSAMAQGCTDAALRPVVEQDQVEVLAFTAKWCGPCQHDKVELDRLRARGIVVREIDVDEHPRLADRYGVVQVPTYVIERNGVEVERTGDVGVIGALLIALLVWLFF